MGARLTVRSSWSSEGGSKPYVFEFDQERVVIGRNASSDVCLPHAAVSGQHATLRAQGAGYVVQDEGSTNGTRVNGVQIPPGRPKPLRTGDVISLGGFALDVEIGVAVAAPTTVDRTGALARQLVRELLDPDGTAAPPPRLLVLNGPDEGKSLELPDPPARMLIGRGDSCDLPLADGDCSREHAEVERDLDGVIIRDLDSKNGILVNDRPVRERRLRDRDEVLLGATVLVFEDVAEGMVREIAAEPDQRVEPPEPAPAHPTQAAPEESEPGVAATSRASDEPGTEPTGTAPDTGPARTPARAPSKAPRRSGANADVIIYLLAGLVLALSIAGLVILLSSG